jgi:hypothetical protein
MQTPVIFRKDTYGVTAVFPTIPGSVGATDSMECYAHIGQHSYCSLEWYRTTAPATPAESAALRKELAAIGYDLDVRRKITRGLWGMRHER